MYRWFALVAFTVAALAALGVWWWFARPVPLVDVAAGRVPCVSYAPYREGQNPFDETTVIPARQIEEDLRVLAGFTACVRTYATDQGIDEVPRIAQDLGLKVLLGAWIGRESEKNSRQLARAVALANRYPETITAVIVGNEVLLRREQPAERLAQLIAETKSMVPVPVTYADVWEFWEKNPGIARVVDFVTIHSLPYWEDDPVAVEGAIDHLAATWRRIQALFPGKRVFIGEAGWPSAGRMREDALPSRVNQARFVRELLARAAQDGIGVNLIEAFDQPWKRKLEGTVGGHWGLFTVQRAPKFVLSGPVAPDPDWREHAAVASMLAALALFAVTRGRRLGWSTLLGLAVFFQFCAGTLVLAGGDLAAAARTPLDWGLGLFQLGLAAAAPVLATRVATDRGAAAPPPAATLLDALQTRHRPGAPTPAVLLGAVRLVLAAAAAAITLALVCDPRYRNFPVALYIGPAAAFLLHAAVSRQPGAAGRLPPEERLLVGLLAIGGVAVAVREGLVNVQALGWAVTALMFAAALAIGARDTAAASVPDGAPLQADGTQRAQHHA